MPHYVAHVPAPDGEDEPRLVGETPHDYVRRTAFDKVARAAKWIHDSFQNPDGKLVGDLYRHWQETSGGTVDQHTWVKTATDSLYILSADTMVVLDGDILGKPTDKTDAAETLKALSGRVHHVHTAIALHHHNQISEALSISTVHFKKLSSSEIDQYCRTDEPMGKAGAYGIQGPAAAFVSHLSGSYTGVMGLPAYETTALLAAAGYR